MRAPKGPVLAVGSRVIVTGPPAGNGRAVLTDHDLVTARATVPNGAEVEILAWHPSGATGTRYRVISVRDGVEGWIGATSLKPAERPRVREATGLTAPLAAVAPRRPTPVPSRVAPRPVTAVRTETVTTKAVARPGKKAKAKRG
jgi:hypothetical protein